jgi:misacylated tRNA(Ala) deacylase
MEQAPILNEHNKDEFPPMHTAEHLVNQTMVRMFGCERSRNAHIERKKSKLNYPLPVRPTEQQVAQIELTINELIAQDLPVKYDFVTRDNIPEGVKLDKLPEDASETIRLVCIGDYDICPCIGNHVKSTRQLGHFRISSTSYTDGIFRLVFRLDDPVE